MRSRVLVTWPSGATLQIRIVRPPVPLMSSSADQVYYALRRHPSFHMLNGLIGMLAQTAEASCCLHKVDGAYANIRLHNHLLALPCFNPQTDAGSFLQTARCQSHATHLISVSILALLGGSLLSRLYALAVFLRNLGYLLRLQLALKSWLADPFTIV